MNGNSNIAKFDAVLTESKIKLSKCSTVADIKNVKALHLILLFLSFFGMGNSIQYFAPKDGTLAMLMRSHSVPLIRIYSDVGRSEVVGKTAVIF